MSEAFDIAVFLQKIAIWAIPVLLAITLHEAAHGYAAHLRGDSTAWMLGRVTLNPFKHIDPFGTVLLPLLMFVLSGFVLGYAKPVPVNFGRLKNIKWDTVFVALAGPFANLFLAFVSVGVLWLANLAPESVQIPLIKMAGASIVINLILMLFNLLPLLPLDGGRVLNALLPIKYSYHYSRLERYGIVVVLLLAFSGLLWSVLMPVLNMSISLLNLVSPINLFMLLNNI